MLTLSRTLKSLSHNYGTINTIVLGICLLTISVPVWAQEEMEKMVVTATRSETPAEDLPVSVSVITAQDIEKMNVKTFDDVLKKSAGIQIRRFQGLNTSTSHTSIYMRGLGDAASTLILKDGIPLNTQYTGSVDLLNTITLDNIERIEIVRGPSSSIYGSNAMGGVINIITKRSSEKVSGSLRLEGGSLDTYLGGLTVSGSTDIVGVRGTVSRKQTNGYEYMDGSSWKDYYETPEMEITSCSLDADVWLGETVLRLGTDYYLEDWLTKTSSKGDGENETGRYTLNYGFPVMDTKLNIGAFYSSSDYSYNKRGYVSSTHAYGSFTDSTSNYDSSTPKDEYGTMIQASRDIGSHAVTMGVDLRWSTCDSDYTYPIGLRSFSGKQSIYSVFFNDQVHIGPRLTLSAGCRYDRWENYDGEAFDDTSGTAIQMNYPETDKAAVSPRAGISYKIDDGTRVRASFGTGFKAPTLYYLYRSGAHGSTKFDLANPELDPEKMTSSYEVGFDKEISGDLSVSCTVFQSRFKDFLAQKTLDASEVPPYYTPEAGQTVLQYVNVGRVSIFGVETELVYNLNDMWSVSANYTYNRSKIMEYELDSELEGNYLSYAPLHQTKFGVNYTNPELFDLGILVTNVSNLFTDLENTESNELGAYQIIDINVGRDLPMGFRVFASIDNVTNEKYRNSTSAYCPPRTFMCGTKFTF